jgi:hypothetical protein
VRGQIIHDDDIANFQSWHQDLFDIGQEQVAIDRSVEQPGATKPSSVKAAMKVEVFQ